MARWKQAQGSDSLPTGLAKNVKMILENQVYLGHMVSHKTQTKSFKNRKLVAVPKEDWIVVKNTHEAIIDEETFELVQKFISVKKRPNKTGRPNMFVGLVNARTVDAIWRSPIQTEESRDSVAGHTPETAISVQLMRFPMTHW